MKTKIIHCIWWIYISLLLAVVVFKFRGSFTELGNRITSTPWGTNYNIVPFRSIGEQIEHISEGWARFNLLGNILPFAPFGFLLPIVWRKFNSFKGIFISGILWILFIEIMQFITRLGSFDIDDIFLNMLGIIIGYTFFIFTRKTSQR